MAAMRDDEIDDLSVNSALANPEDDTDEDMGLNSFESDEYAESDEETDDDD